MIYHIHISNMLWLVIISQALKDKITLCNVTISESGGEDSNDYE